MRIVLGVVVGLIAVVAVAFGVGLLLPREHRASSRVTLTAAPEVVWPVVRDLASLVGTWSELTSARRIADASGMDFFFKQEGGFEMRLIVEAASEPSRMVTRIDAPPDAAFGGTWTYRLEPVSGGTRLTVTEDGYVSNPLFRVMMKAMGVHRTVDGYLKALGKKLGEAVTVEHVK